MITEKQLARRRKKELLGLGYIFSGLAVLGILTPLFLLCLFISPILAIIFLIILLIIVVLLK